LFLAVGAALLNVILIPLVKSAARGEVGRMIDEHNEDSGAHPGLTITSKSEIANAAFRASEAAAAAARAETATAAAASRADATMSAFRAEVREQLDRFGDEIRQLRAEISDLRVALANRARTVVKRGK
jgi:hypothetical protein